MFGIDDMAVAGGLGALANLGGGFMSAAGAAGQNAAAMQANQNAMSMAMRANDLNQWFFAKNWENQMYASNTAYQRSVADMKAAGLNPILAYQQGGASAPSGGMSSGNTVSLQNPAPANPAGEMGRGISRMVSSATDAMNAIQTIRNNVATEQKLKADTALSAANANKALADTDVSKETLKNIPYARDLLGSQSAAAQAAAGASRAAAGLSSAQTQSVQQDALRKQQYGDSVLGHNVNSLEKMADRLLGAIGNAFGSSGVKASTPRPDGTRRRF